MFVLFVSHQWLGSEHPDPTGQQLSVLRCALRRMLSGRLSVEEDLSLGGKSRGAIEKQEFHRGKWRFDLWNLVFLAANMVIESSMKNMV